MNFHSLRAKNYVNLPKFDDFFSTLLNDTKVLLQDNMTRSQKLDKMELVLKRIKEAKKSIEDFKENEEFIPKNKNIENASRWLNFSQNLSNGGNRMTSIKNSKMSKLKNGDRRIRFSTVGNLKLRLRRNKSTLAREKKSNHSFLKTPLNFSAIVKSPRIKSPTQPGVRTNPGKFKIFFNDLNISQKSYSRGNPISL